MACMLGGWPDDFEDEEDEKDPDQQYLSTPF
jgi:hypothetical protein